MSVREVMLVLMVILQAFGRGRGCLEEESEGLLKLKAAFNYPKPNVSSLPSWDISQEIDCCRWEKVTCDPISKRVTHLSLNSSRPLDLGQWTLNTSLFLPFSHLQVLRLDSNRLIGLTPFPRLGNLEVLDIELTSLMKLEVLNLGYNSIAGNIPLSVGALPSLKALSFKRNLLNGSFPIEVVCSLKNLEELDLSRNQFQGSLPPCLGDLTSLRLLELKENNLEGTIPASLFTNLTFLEYVSLSSNNFEGSFSFHLLANSPKLEVFELVNNNNKLEIETELPPGQFLPFQLRILRLSNCTLNKPTGGIVPSFLATQQNLRIVDLSHNGISGNVPSWLLGNNTSLEYFNLMNNSLVGSLDLVPNLQNPHLFWFDVSNNRINGEIPSNLGFAFPNLLFLNMSRNKFQGTIPPSLGELRNLYSLDLSNNSLSGELPEHMAIGCVNLTFLKLSNNQLNGKILPENSNLLQLWTLHLDNNHFTGGISKGILNSTKLSLLDISQNIVSGEIPDWIGDMKSLSSLVLSRNSLEGSIPNGICNLNHLRYLDLSHNHLGSTVPPCFNLTSLRHFHIQNNHLSGPIPSVLSRASSLVTLDLRDNKISGMIPSWITLLPKLRILLLQGNNLHGTIPFSLCQLTNISIVDFSHNHLSGSIPSCLVNIGFGRRSLFDGTFGGSSFGWTNYRSVTTYSHTNQLKVYQYIVADYYMHDENDLVQFVTKRRYESFEGNVLYFMSGVDLSYNQLTGSIPSDIGLLSGIHTLNFSNNLLMDSIPESFSHLNQIESLDLSHNKLSGEIPSQLVGLNFLSVFTVAYNNLSGSVPEMKGQFATFDQRSYEGNLLLCGLPLQRNCSSNSKQHPSNKEEDDGNSSFRDYFLYGFAGSFGVAFVGVVAFLYLESYYWGLVLRFLSVQLSKLPLCKWISELIGSSL